MDAAWPGLMGVDPRDLQLNRTESYDLNISPQENSSNGIQYNDDSWPSLQASTGGFMPTALAGPHLEIGVFDVEGPAFGGNYQINGAPVLERDDVWYLQSHQGDFVGIRNSTPSIDLTSQHSLPPFLCPLVEQVPSEIPQFSNQEQHTMTVHPPANSQGSQVTSSTHTLRGVSLQARRTRRLRRGDYVRASRTVSSRSTTSPVSRNRRPDPPQQLAPALSGSAQGKAPKGARNLPSAQSSGECDTERNASNHHITVLREAIALTRESIKPFSPFSRRKATDLIKQVAELIDQLELLAVEEEKYGNASSDDDEATQPSTTASSQDTLSNSELVDVDSETDNTSISSISHQPIVDGQNSVSVEDDQREPVHRPCLQCGHKSLYYCTREGCQYSTHSIAEWKRHEESQKHSQRERFMCLECPQSPPAADMNGDSVCEFCRTSFPELGTNLTAHYLQCRSAQKSCTTYGRKDRLIAHLRTQHRINAHVSQIAAAGKFTIDCEWPRQCGFCGVTFMTWDERMDHIASHFEDGLDMSSWKRPLPPPKDPHPGLEPQPKDGDDSDDDMDDNHSRPSRHRTGIRDKANPSGSKQTNSGTQQKRRGASHHGGRRQRQQVPLADLEIEADSDATSNPEEIRGMLAAERMSSGTGVSGLKTTSVALDRYLNDEEEPFRVGTIPGSFVRSTESSRQDIIEIYGTIGSDDASQKQGIAGNEWHESSISQQPHSSFSAQRSPRSQSGFHETLASIDDSVFQSKTFMHDTLTGKALLENVDVLYTTIDQLLGQGLGYNDWNLELENLGAFAYPKSLQNLIIEKEFAFFKEEILRLQSQPNTTPGLKSKTNSLESILSQGSTSKRSRHSSTESGLVADMPFKYTPVTGRVNRAKKVYMCDICLPAKARPRMFHEYMLIKLQGFRREKDLRRHQLSHQTPLYPCKFEDCEKAFHRPYLLDRHELRHETPGETARKHFVGCQIRQLIIPLSSLPQFNFWGLPYWSASLPTLDSIKGLPQRSNVAIIPEWTPNPYAYFDILGGTSTGRLIAIMLGRLQMIVDSCIEAEISLSDKVSQKNSSYRINLKARLQGRFDKAELETLIKQILVDLGLNEDMLLKNSAEVSSFFRLQHEITKGSAYQSLSKHQHPTPTEIINENNSERETGLKEYITSCWRFLTFDDMLGKLKCRSTNSRKRRYSMDVHDIPQSCVNDLDAASTNRLITNHVSREIREYDPRFFEEPLLVLER
ncbi:hypothetical protein V8E51_016245 [Hyaloscypha variabilis]